MRKPKPKPPTVPPEAPATLRRQLEAHLEDGAGFDELAERFGLTDRALEDELRHLERSLKAQGRRLKVDPARCRSCGYVFRSRAHLRPPTRCRKCKEEQVEAPRLELG